MLLIGDSICLDKIITDNIQAGFYEGKVVPCLVYKGQYIKEVNKTNSSTLNDLKEIIEEVIVSKNQTENRAYPSFLVTRQIGTDRPESTLKMYMPQTRVSLVYVSNGDIRVWTPTNKELLQDLKYFCGHAGKDNITIIKKINDMLGVSRDFSVQKLLADPVRDPMSIGSQYVGIVRNSFEDLTLNVSAFFALFKHIMISEDMRFDGQQHLGRYKLQVAALRYVLNNEDIDEVLK